MHLLQRQVLIFFTIIVWGDFAVGNVAFHFPDGVELSDLIKSVAVWKKDRIFLFNPQETKGTIKIIAPEKITEEDAYAAFLSSLNQLGYAAIEVQDTIKIEKLDKGKKSTSKVYEKEFPLSQDVITYIHPLKMADAAELKRILTNFTNAGTIQISEKSNMLIFTDTGMHVDRLMRIIEVLDVDRQKVRVEVYPVIRLSADIMLSHLQTAFKRAPEDKNYTDCTFLSDARTNSVIISAPVQKIEFLLTFIKEIDSSAKQGDVGSHFHLVPLQFAEAKKVATLLEAAKIVDKEDKNAMGIKKEPIRFVADEPSNSLFIRADNEAYHALLPLIRKLDEKKRQYGIELHIFSVTNSSTLNFGTSILAGAASNKVKSLIGWEASQTTPLVVASSSTATTGVSQNQSAQGVASVFDEGITFSYLSGTQVEVPGIGSFTPQGLLKTLKIDSSTKVLSEPFILTQDQEEATFTVGQRLFFTIQIPGGLASSQPQSSVDKQDIGLTIRLKPHGDAQGLYTQLDIDLEETIITTIDPTTGYPQLGKKKAKHVLQARNGQMILMSGLKRSTRSKSEKKIPGISEIPILGIFARTSQEMQTEENLMLFIMAKPMEDTSEYSGQYDKDVQKMKKQDVITRSQS